MSMNAPGASDSPMSVTYALGRDTAEAERLRRQTTELQPLAAELLDRVGAAEGQSAIDVGCGPRGILELLAERVGPRGRVVGLEVDPVHVAMARELMAEQGLTNVEVIQADARHTGLPPASFDVAHARTVLVNVPDPGAVLAEMTRLVRPGGWVASLEPDVAVHLYYPANPAWDRLMRSPSPPFKPMVRTHSSAAVYRSCFARLVSATSACERTPSFTHPATPVALSVWTSCAACGPRSWRWASPASKNLTIWIVPHENISTILTPWFSLICSSWPGAANPEPSRV